jgi:hypothetical protein
VEKGGVMAGQELQTEELYGVAKKMSLQMRDLPLHTHGALIQMINVDFEHRKLGMQRAEKLAQEERQERALKLQEQQMELMRRQQQPEKEVQKAEPEPVQ